jgi:DNA-binding NarL/FixJ family response regulator
MSEVPGMSGKGATVRVLVADDQTVVREGLVTSLSVLPGVEVVGAAANGEQAVALVGRYRPQVVLMDLRMPVMDGVEATRRIHRDYPGTAVVVLTTYADDESILAALRAGALGYLTKEAGRDQIARALHAAAAGQAILDPAVQARLVAATGTPSDAAPSRPLPDGLTPREAEVLALIAAGRANAQIAAALVVTQSTVKTHINNIFAKTGVTDRAQAVRYAYSHALADPGEAEPHVRAGSPTAASRPHTSRDARDIHDRPAH